MRASSILLRVVGGGPVANKVKNPGTLLEQLISRRNKNQVAMQQVIVGASVC